MDCFYPIKVPRYVGCNIIQNGIKLRSRRQNGFIQVPCGRCPACRRRKQNEWAFRILEEAKVNKTVAFITLTYDDEHLIFSDSGIPTLFPDHCTTFLKNLRYDLEYLHDDKTISFRYFLCGEYGDQFDRPHYHMILFYNGDLPSSEIEHFVKSRWIHGFSLYEPGISPGRAKYCAKYSMKSVGFDYLDCVPPFARMSRRPGIGKSFLSSIDFEQFRQRDLWHVYDHKGTPYALPRYYKEMIYSRDECDEHSLLLSRLKDLKFDSLYIEDSSTFKFLDDKIKYSEHLFIKHLKKENYGFRYKEFKPKFINRTNNYDIQPSTDF